MLTEKRDEWVSTTVEACKKAGIDYSISRHPADMGDFSQYQVTEMSMYEAIRQGTIFISRFGSGIIESIAMGKPAIYHNPHGEKVPKFQNPLGAYQVSDSVESLTKAIQTVLSSPKDPRPNAKKFLKLHASALQKVPAGQRLGNAIIAALREPNHATDKKRVSSAV